MGLFGSLSPDTQAMLGGGIFQNAPQSIAPQPVSIPQGMFAGPPTIKAPQPGFNAPGGWAEKLGRIGAILMSSAGDDAGSRLLQGQDDTRLQTMKHQQALEDYRNQSLAALQREQAMYDYKLAHPEMTDIEKAALVAGIQPGTPDWQDAMKRAFQFKLDPPHLVNGPNNSTILVGGPFGYPGLPNGAPAPSSAPVPSPEAIADLKRNPALAKDFDGFYGPGSSARVLGGATATPSRTFP